MVVVVILGVLGTQVVLRINTNSPDKNLRKEAQRLRVLLDLAADEALLSLNVIGVHTLSNGYGFYTRVTDAEGAVTWEPFDAGGRLRQRELPEDQELKLELEAQQVVLNTAEEQTDEEDPLTPHIWLLPDGEIMPQYKFTMEREDGEYVWEVQTDDEGRFSVDSVKF